MEGAPHPAECWIQDPGTCAAVLLIFSVLARPRADAASRRARADILGTLMGMGLFTGIAQAADDLSRLTPFACIAGAALLLALWSLRWSPEEKRARDLSLGRLLTRGLPLCLWTLTMWSMLPAGNEVSTRWMRWLSDPLDPIVYTHRHSLVLLVVVCGLPASLLLGEILSHVLWKRYGEDLAPARSPWLPWVLADARQRMGPSDEPVGCYVVGHMRWTPFGALIQLALAIFVETALMLSARDMPFWRCLGAPPEQQTFVFTMLFVTLILSCARAPLPAVWILTVWAVPFFHGAYFPAALSPQALAIVISVTTALGVREMVGRGRERLIIVGRSKAYRYRIPLAGPPCLEGSGILEADEVAPDHRYQPLDGGTSTPPFRVPAPSWGPGLVAFAAVSGLLVGDHYTRLDRAFNNLGNASSSVLALEAGLTDRAEILAAAVLASDPCNPLALGIMAELRCRQGRHEEALEWARRAERWKDLRISSRKSILCGSTLRPQ